MIAFMVFTGVRVGEALGIRWSEIDFSAETIRVRGQLGRNRERGPTKTEASNRNVVLMPDLARVLREHKLRSLYTNPSDYVFPGPTGEARSHRAVGRGIERALTRAGIEGVSAHNFRHTFASMLIVGLGYEAVAVSKQLGHTRASFTQDVYSHMFDQENHHHELRRRVAESYGHLLSDVNELSTGALDGTQDEPAAEAATAHIRG